MISQNHMKNKLQKFIYILTGLIMLPLPALALRDNRGCPVGGSLISGLLCNIQQLINSIVPILIALGVVYFVWGVIRFMIADSEEAKTKGKDHIIYGLIGFTVIIGMWGLVNLVVNTLGFSASELVAPSFAPIQVNNNVVQGSDSGGTCPTGKDFQGLAKFVTCVINNSIIPLIFAIAIVMFIWGAVKFFIINANEEAQREQGKQFMIWGIIALTVMMTVWALISFLSSTFGLGDAKLLPQVCPPGDTKCGK
jgi:hypothetical protein